MRRLLRWTDPVLLGVSTVFLAGLLVCVVLAVFSRYVLQLSLVWSDEVAVYLFIWGSLIAAAIDVGRNEHFSISVFVDLLPARFRKILDVGITVLCMAFALIVAWKGSQWSWRMRSDLSPALQMPQGGFYAVIPLAAAYMLIHLMNRLMRVFGKHPGHTNEE